MHLFGRSRLRMTAAALALTLVAAACTADDEPAIGLEPAGDENTTIAAEVASYDLVADRPGRFTVGIFAADKASLVAYGTVLFRLAHLGSGEGPDSEPELRSPVTASFLPIPGQDIDTEAPGPRFVSASEAIGVYGAQDVLFDEPGFWEVRVTAAIDGEQHTATAAFEVLEESAVPAVGDPAPRTRQPLAGDPGVDPRSIDSRAAPDRPIPDPELHSITVADALDAGTPVMVVVSTPTYCQSRFCGPITDSVQRLAQRYGDRMAFVHLEVWKDFEATTLNRAAAEWIFPTPQTDAREPWVFVVDGNGIIVARFDNVATDAGLDAAVQDVLAR